jgi:hypothetical protein
MNVLGHGAAAPGLTRGPNPYICWVIDEYSNFILFLLLCVLATSPDEEPPKQALLITITAYPTQFKLNSTHFMPIQTKTSYNCSKLLTSHIPIIHKENFKLKLRRRVVTVTGSSRQVQDGIDEVVSCLATVL